SDFELPGDADVINKLLKDFGGAGIALKEAEIAQKITDLEPVARQQVMDGK
ncbi:MAG: ATPase inhibitor subunit zeta, partial [Rickettsiales bacterium]